MEEFKIGIEFRIKNVIKDALLEYERLKKIIYFPPQN